MDDRRKAKSKPEVSIAHALGFSSEDLEKNSRGEISFRQHEQLRKQRNRYRLFFISSVFVFLCFFAYFYNIYTYGYDAIWFYEVIFMALLGWIAYKVGQLFWGVQRKLQSNKVGMIQGRVNLRFVRRRLTFGLINRLEMQVGDLTFPVNKSGYAKIVNK